MPFRASSSIDPLYGSFSASPSQGVLISDTKGGAVAIFREKRSNDAAIYAQKIFNTGTYISQILGLKTELVGDSVKIIWYSANVTPDSYYEIEQSVFSDTGLSDSSILSE